MGKHKKHHYGGKSSSSSSSSSSSDSDDAQYKHLPKHERKRMKKLRKQMKKGKIPPGSVPGMYPGHGGHPHGMPHGMHGAPPYGAPSGTYPGQPAYPAGGYPTGMAPPPGSYAPGAQPYPGGLPPAAQPYPGGPPPGGAYPQVPNPAYPAQPGYPGGAPPPAGGYPGGFAPSAGGYAPPPGAGVKTGPDFTQPNPYGGAPPGQPGYPQPGGIPPQPGYPQAGGQPGYPQAGGQQPGYPQAGGQPGYPQGSGQQPGYPQSGGGPPPQPGYAPPGQPGAPGGMPPGQPGAPGGMPPGQMAPGGVTGAAAQFQRMGLQGTADVPRPTLVPAQNFNAEADAGVIRKAMKGMGTDEQAIVNIISTRSNLQRQEIMKMFKTMYGKDLIQDLESELSGDFNEAIMALFKATTYYDAWSLHQAMSGAGTKEASLIEILCTRTNTEIREINGCYQQYYHRSLEKDIMDDTSGHFKRLLVSCCQANRAELTPEQLQRVQYEGPECVIDRNLARDDAQRLFQAGEAKMGTDESAFLQVMAVRHYYQMRATFEEYVKVAGRDILSSIDREMSGDLKAGFKALVMSAKNRPEYFADRLDNAMRGAGTKDSTLIRVIVSRAEMDLQDIKEVYLFKYHKTLATAIKSDTRGDYKRLLLALVGQ